MIHRLLAALGLMLASLAVHAAPSGIERLDRFLEDLTSLQGEFRQRLPADGLNPFREARGRLVMARPGRFRWEYTHPIGQLLVADGRYLWIYDPDLAQVTRRPVDEALGETPAFLLGGTGRLEDHFQIIDGGQGEGLAWVLLLPKDGDAGIEGIRLGFDAKGLKRMIMTDLLGRSSDLEFIDLRRNVHVDPELFRFQPPAGADLFAPLD